MTISPWNLHTQKMFPAHDKFLLLIKRRLTALVEPYRSKTQAGPAAAQ